MQGGGGTGGEWATIQCFVEWMVSDHAKAAIVVAPVTVGTEHGSARGGVDENRKWCRVEEGRTLFVT